MGIDGRFRLRVLHFNDLHGRLADVTPGEIRPAFSRIAGFIKRARAEVAGRPDAGVLVLSGGDDLVGSPFAEPAGARPAQFRCHPAYRLYSAAGVDAAAVGNHELDWGLGMLSLAAERDARFPLLSANLLAASGRLHPIRRWTVAVVNGLRVGILGLTTQSEVKQVVGGEFRIGDPLAAARELLPEVRERSDVVIILSHLGHREGDALPPPGGMRDAELARRLPRGAVPLIVGGHTHSVLNENGLYPANEINGIWLAQAGCNGRYLGDIEIEVTRAAAHVVAARLWPAESLPEDSEFEQAHVLPLALEVQRLLAEPLGRVSGGECDSAWAQDRFAGEECALANFVSDALTARCRAAGLPVDFFMLDASGISAGLPPAGALTFGDLFAMAPNADSIDVVRLPSAELPAFLDDNARRADPAGEAREERGFAQFSRELRHRIAAGDGRASGITVSGQPLSALGGRELLIGCSSFFRHAALRWEQRAAQEGRPVFATERLRRAATGLALREELSAHVRATGMINEATGLARDGRVSFEPRGNWHRSQ